MRCAGLTRLRIQGLQPQIIKAVLCQAILFVCKDQFAAWTMLLFSLFSRTRKTPVAMADAN